MSTTYIALDGEMSSPNFAGGGQLIQLGLFHLPHYMEIELPLSHGYSSYINFPENGLWEESAESIHGITKESLLSAPDKEKVDSFLYNWLKETFKATPHKGNLKAVGMNVGSFDMPFIERALPFTATLFSKRSVDLNGLCFAMSDMEYNGEPLTHNQWKRLSLEYGRRRFAQDNDTNDSTIAHDAKFDAWVHGYAYLFLQRSMRGIDTPMPFADIPESPMQSTITELLELGLTTAEISASALVPETFVKGWSIGGRPTNTQWIQGISELYNRMVTTPKK